MTHVNKIPTSCFRLNVFPLKKLKKRNYSVVLNVISKQKTFNGKPRMITIIEISQKMMSVSCSYVPICTS